MSTYKKYLREEDAYDFDDEEGKAFHAANPHASKGFPKPESEPRLDMQALINLKLLAASIGMDNPETIMSLRKGIGRLENETPLNWAQAGPLLKILRKILSSDKAKLRLLLK